MSPADDDSDIADGRLIAAAPELLEALLRIRNVLYPGGDLDHEWNGADDISEIAEIIGSVAAINNATKED